MSVADDTGIVRLSVNLAPDVAKALQDLRQSQRSSLTEEIRRAISLLYYLQKEIDAGKRLLVEDAQGNAQVISIPK